MILFAWWFGFCCGWICTKDWWREPYDYHSDVWLTKADTNEARADAVLQALDDKLYILGGAGDLNKLRISSIEIYDILQDQWTVLEEEPGFPYSFAASVVNKHEVILIGGISEDTRSVSSTVSVYDTARNKMTFQWSLKFNFGKAKRNILDWSSLLHFFCQGETYYYPGTC